MFARSGPRWFSIAAHRPFVDDLARGLLRELAPQGPEALSDAVVLVPGRRAARALAEAFVAAAEGQALLLPQIRAIGDLDEGEPPFEPGTVSLDLPAAIEPRRRRYELARLIYDRRHVFEQPVDAAGALELADALGAFLDSCHLEEADAAARIDTLVEGDLARHWRLSAEFLSIALRQWPARLRELGLVDPADRQVRLLRALADQWRAAPPETPLIAAGSTGGEPASADLLAAVAAAPKGAVVLPGLDLDLADDAWDRIEGDGGEQHPQGAMKRLLERAGVSRADVRPWASFEPGAESSRGRARRRIINEALRPAEATADWLDQIDRLRAEGDRTGVNVIGEGLAGLSLLSARTEEQAACAAALLLRETLETPGKTAALVTPDLDLARRVSARLTRWGVTVDSSAGAPLTAFPVGVLIAVTARLADKPCDPVLLLAALKHPLVRLGLDDGERRRPLRLFERRALRGPRPRHWGDIERRLTYAEPERKDDEAEHAHAARCEREAADCEACEAVAEPLRAAVQAFADAFSRPISGPEAARAHVRLLEALAADENGRLGGLWAGPAGEQAASLFASLLTEAEGLPAMDGRSWAAAVDALLQREQVRTGGASHARIRILGAIEARLVRSDRLILAGLEEGVWPKAAPTDPFLSRPMRSGLGLPPPERRVGVSAHDFAQGACAPEVFLLHTERRAGAPTVQSRWLWRLETLAKGAGVPLPRADHVTRWAEALDAPETFRPAPRPMPKPPAADRPRGLSVTRVETWVRDPYEIYAREILRLRRLDPPDTVMEAATRGTAVHAALERFAQCYPDTAPAECPAVFERLLNEALEEAGLTDHARARESVLSRNSGPWFAAFEAERRARSCDLLVEQRGTVEILIDGEPFKLTAKADRIEVVDGRAAVLDFKTGAPPSKKQVESDFAPQLTLTAAILQAGGFAKAGPVGAGELTYVRVTGRRPVAEVRTVVDEAGAPDAVDRVLAGLHARVRRFRDPDTPYASWTAPQWRKHAGDYDHLARVWEWAVLGADEAEGDG